MRKAIAVSFASTIGGALVIVLAITGLRSQHHHASHVAHSRGYAACVTVNGSPHVTVTNTGTVPIAVDFLPVAVFNSAGEQVASVEVTPPAESEAQVEPGQSMTFSDDQGRWDPSWASCKVVSQAS